MAPLVYIIVFIISGYLLLSAVQGRPSFILLLPILLFTVGLGWYLNKHIQEEHEENLKKGFQYAEDEQQADHWLHQSFVPKVNILFKKHIKETILYCGLILLGFIFFWTYFVAGVMNALLSVLITLVLYTIFVYYLLHVDKWYKHFFKRVPRPYRHLRSNDWIHAYVVLFPFALLCSLIYTLFNYPVTLMYVLVTIPLFFFAYTLLFVCIYCGAIVYLEYKKEQEKNTEKHVKDMLEE